LHVIELRLQAWWRTFLSSIAARDVSRRPVEWICVGGGEPTNLESHVFAIVAEPLKRSVSPQRRRPTRSGADHQLVLSIRTDRDSHV
jgi:hypothetical protein